MDGLIGRKVGMTQVFEDNGLAIPCTVLRVGPCVVVQRRDKGRDGYEAVQIGLVEPTKVRGGGREGGGKRSKGVNRAQKGHFDKAKVAPMKRLREFRLAPGADADGGVAVGLASGHALVRELAERPVGGGEEPP